MASWPAQENSASTRPDGPPRGRRDQQPPPRAHGGPCPRATRRHPHGQAHHHLGRRLQVGHRRHPRLARPRRRPVTQRTRRHRHRHGPPGCRQRPQAVPRTRLRRRPDRRRPGHRPPAAPHRVATVLPHRPTSTTLTRTDSPSTPRTPASSTAAAPSTPIPGAKPDGRSGPSADLVPPTEWAAPDDETRSTVGRASRICLRSHRSWLPLAVITRDRGHSCAGSTPGGSHVPVGQSIPSVALGDDE